MALGRTTLISELFFVLQGHHKPVQRNVDGTEDIDPIGDLKDCGDLYEELEWCLAEHDRDFSKCQKPIKAVRACVEAQAKLELKLSSSKAESATQHAT